MGILLNLGRNRSHFRTLNYLAVNENIYVMDNHLAAFYCWSKVLDPLNSYKLLHIDRHHDLSNTLVKKGFHLYKNIAFKSLSIDEILNLSVDGFQMVMWDNFIELYNVFNPYTFQDFEFVCPQKLPKSYNRYKRHSLKSWIKKERTTSEMFELIHPERLASVIDIDMDVFFREKNGLYKSVVTEVEMQAFAEKIKPMVKDAVVVTIALSPECCGGWDNSIAMYNLLNKYLKLDVDVIC